MYKRQQLEPLKVTSNIIEASGSKIPFTFIKPELVVEIEAVDIINKNSSFDKKITLAITGASGSAYALRLLECLVAANYQ